MAEKYFLFGSYGDMIEQLASILALRSQIENHDIGAFIGYPVGDYVRAKPLGRKLYIQLYSEKLPPYRASPSKDFKVAVVTVPEPSLATLDNWAEIKNAVGGVNGYTFGKWRTTITYEGGRTTVVQASTKEVSEKIAKQLAKLSTLPVIKEITTETKALGKYAANQGLAIKTVQIYPGTYYALDSKPYNPKSPTGANPQQQKVSTLSGDYKRARIPRIALWVTKQPPNLKEAIRKMLGYSPNTK